MFIAFAVFFVVHQSPEEQWIFGFIGYSIPFLLFIHVLLLLYWLFRRSWKLFIPVIALLAGWQHVGSTFQLNLLGQNEAAGIKVINYNVRVFNVYEHLENVNPKAAEAMIAWLIEQQADILCLQEFYNDKSSPRFNAKEQLQENGYPYSYFFDEKRNSAGAAFGLAIFSKFPIVNKEVIPFNNPEKNRAIFVDFLYSNDTFRVYNVHLHSMKLRLDELAQEEKEKEMLDKIKENFYRMRSGFKGRANEVDILKEKMQQSPYPAILAGDFNDLPYSYTYLSFSEFLNNSFEEKGQGFGITYKNIPGFIRIDNQFSSKELEVTSHNVFSDINYSDHYPVAATYDLQEK